MKFLIACLAWACATICAEAAQPTPKALAAVWAQEDRYWALSNASEFDLYYKLFDERFTGWPCASSTPTSTAGLTPSTAGFPPAGAKRRVVLDEKAASGGGDFLVVYYRAKTTTEDSGGKVTNMTRNFTHTWAASPSGWRIIGGMCRFEDPSLAH
jgi:Domain of unknown function (DUF4440)